MLPILEEKLSGIQNLEDYSELLKALLDRFKVNCDKLPQYINADGEWYVTVKIKKGDWKGVIPGRYKGVVRFELYFTIRILI